MRNTTLCSYALGLAFLVANFALAAPQTGRQDAPKSDKVLPADAVPQEIGKPGTQYPMVDAVLRPDAPVHGDATGTAARELVDLAGAPGGGFAAVWQDHRDGNMGIYFARVGLDGQALENERPVYSRARTSRELDPSIAVNGVGAGVVSWREKSMPNGYYYTRLFDAQGKTSPEHLPMGFEFPEGGGGRGGRDAGGGGRGAELVQPSVAALVDGSGVCVWLAGKRAMLQVIRAAGPLVEQPTEISRPDHPATARPVLGAAVDGTLLAAWGTSVGIECIVRPPRGPDERNVLGLGTPLDVQSDHRGGWWLAVEHEGRRVLRHANAHGKVGRELALPGALVDFAVADFGLLALLGPGRRDGPHQLVVVPLTEDSGVAGEPVTLRSETGAMLGNVRVAASGKVGLVAWRERRGPDQLIVARTVDAELEFGPVRELTHDRGTSNQTSPDVASNGVDRAVSAWVDRRNGENEVWARVLDPKLGFAGPEFALPVRAGAESTPVEPLPGAMPAVAMAQDARFAVVWFDTRDDGVGLLAQGFSADGKPLGEAVSFDAGLKGNGDVALVAVSDGYVAFWTRGAAGLAARRMDFACLPLGEPVVLSADDTAANVSACRLDVPPRERDDRAFVVAWDIAAPGLGRRLRARVLGARLELQARELSFDTMYLGADWDPAVAPLDDGGFFLFWTAGDQRVRDVFARGFDGDGRPRSQPLSVSVRANEQDYPELARLADGSLLLAWEDDISGQDFVLARRLSADLKKFGPPLEICERPEEFLRAHNHARVAAMGAGFVAVWTDMRRSRGADVYWKIVGPRFDARGGARK